MSYDKTSLVRALVPKSYHFDGYNELKCPNSRDKPFFTDNHIQMGGYHLTTHMVSSDTLSLQFSSVCKRGMITFLPYTITLSEYVSKLQKAIQDSCDFITFDIIAKYDVYQKYCVPCGDSNNACKQLRSSQPHSVYAAVSFNLSEVEKALAAYYKITKTTNGGMTSMKNNKNMFGMKLEFGISKDPNIASTLMGVAVKTVYDGSWVIFDKATNSRKNIGKMKMGNFPIVMLPTNTLVPGDLIKLNGKYMSVQSVNPGGSIKVIDTAAGVVQEIIPESSLILGAPIFTKVIAMDASTFTDKGSNQNISGNLLAAMCKMQWSEGGQADVSLDNVSDSSFNGLGQYLPLLLASGGNLGGMFAGGDGNLDITKLFMLGAVSGDSDSGDATQMLVLSQLLGGGNSLFGSALTTPTAASDDIVVCANCGINYPAGTNFCSKCGSHTKSLQPTCRECGATLSKDAVFCSNCGTKVNLTSCPECGADLGEGAKFCSKCGHNLSAKPNVPAETEAPAAVVVETK